MSVEQFLEGERRIAELESCLAEATRELALRAAAALASGSSGAAATGALLSAAWGDGFPGASPQAVPPAAAPTLEERER